MAQGNPVLAVWTATDSTIRTFELSGDAFIQVGASGGKSHVGPPGDAQTSFRPSFDWTAEGDKLLFLHSPASNFSTLASFDASLTPLGSINTGTSAGQGNTYGDLNPANNVFYFTNTPAANAISVFRFALAENGALTAQNTGTQAGTRLTLTGTVAALSVSPDGVTIVRSGAYPTFSQVEVRTVDANGTTSVVKGISCAWDIMAWTPDSKYLIVADKTGTVQVHKRLTANTFEQTFHQGSNVLGTPVQVAVAADNRTVAIGYVNAGTYSTAIYRRMGGLLIETEVIAGIGSLLSFDGSGLVLVDAAAKRAFRKNNGFEEILGAMDDVPNNVAVQAISPHVLNPTGIARLYDGGIAGLTHGDTPLQGLKLTLLSPDAVFDSSHTALNVAAGGYEVTEGRWPAGGVALQNVGFIDLGSDVAVVADDFVYPVLESPLIFRFGIIHDDGKPLIWLDFQEEVGIPVATGLKIDFSTTGFVAFLR